MNAMSTNDALLAIGPSFGSKHSAVVPSGGDLRENRERDFRRVAAAEIEPDRSVEPADLGRGEAVLGQPFAPERLRFPRADYADVGRVGAERDVDRRLVELGVMSE